MSPDPGLAEDILGRAVKSGADQAEVFYKSYKNIAVEIKDQAVESLSSSFSSGYCVRVIRNHRLGFSFSTDVSESDRVIARAMDACRSVDEDLFKALDKGLYIVAAMGIHMVNSISGDFSIGVTGLWIENGEVAFPVKEAVISGNLIDFFGKVSAVGDDMRFYGSVGSPSLIIPDVDVSA